MVTPAPPPGPGVDARGVPVLDPTENVKALNEAGLKRQDDLRELEAKHIRELMSLQSEYDSQLRDAEAKRIDAIRLVDVGAVQRAAEVQAAQAEALRLQVAAAAQAAQTALSAALDPIQKDIADLRRAQYEAQGQKTQVVEGRASYAAFYAAAGFALALLIAGIAVIGFIAANSGG